jgi:hypothetical protein
MMRFLHWVVNGQPLNMYMVDHQVHLALYLTMAVVNAVLSHRKNGRYLSLFDHLVDHGVTTMWSIEKSALTIASPYLSLLRVSLDSPVNSAWSTAVLLVLDVSEDTPFESLESFPVQSTRQIRVNGVRLFTNRDSCFGGMNEKSCW